MTNCGHGGRLIECSVLDAGLEMLTTNRVATAIVFTNTISLMYI
jgi:hypothetical protein